MNEPIHIISLGAGVQSSTMALMAAAGEIKPMPVAAIFADTQAEPKSVYIWLDWLEKQLPFPVRRVTQGSIIDDTLTIRKHSNGIGVWSRSGIPAFTLGKDGSVGIMNRQCTADFKLVPLRRESRQILKEASVKSGVSWIGISLDEAHRMKDSRVKYLTNRFPLIDLRMSRHDCIRWLKSRSFPTPPKSACVFCPFHSDHEWRRLRDEEPDEFQKAVEFETAFRDVKRQNDMRGEVFLHRQCVTLDKVDLSTDLERGQQSLFGNECEGMCGV